MAATSLKSQYKNTLQTFKAYQAAVNEGAIVSITDLAGRILYVNAKFIEVSKFSAEELIGNTHRLINSGYHPQSFFKDLWQTIQSGNHWRGQIKNKARDGSYYWVDTVITPVYDNENRIFQYLSIRNLITVQKENEEKLVRFQELIMSREQQLKDAQEVSKTGSWYIETPGNHLEWSDETYRIFGIPQSSPMTYEAFLERVHPEDRNRINTSWEKGLKNGSYNVEHRIITPGGEKWVIERARFELDEKASLKKAIGTVQDITENKKIENTLAESENLYKKLFNNSPFVIGILEKNSLRFLEVNKTATDLYGYGRDEFLKLTAYDIRVPEEHQDLKTRVNEGTYANDRTVRRHKKKNGDILLIEPAITDINYKGNEAYLITIVDVTEKLKIQDELISAKINLQKETVRAAIEAEEKSRAEIGRELHDNVNQLLVASTFYFKKAIPASERDKLFIKNGIDIVLTAVDEIRKLSYSLVSPSLENTTLGQAIRKLSENFLLTNIDVEINIDINEDRLKQGLGINIYRIVQEQFNNIVKYSEAKKVVVALTQSAGYITLEISDNGKGFDSNGQVRGIGFSNIVHRAEAYNGKVLIKSKPGEGCCLHVDFPNQ